MTTKELTQNDERWEERAYSLAEIENMAHNFYDVSFRREGESSEDRRKRCRKYVYHLPVQVRQYIHENEALKLTLKAILNHDFD